MFRGKIIRALVAIIGGCLICTLAAAQQKAPDKAVKKIQQKAIQKIEAQARIKVPFRPTVQGIDPAVVSLQAKVKRQISPHTAEIMIVGVVQNIGTQDFVSGVNQQAVRLYEKLPGASTNAIATKEFVTLKSGETIKVQVMREWSTSVEFPADFTLQIDYDPDIAIDGNPQNDDVKNEDNRRTLKGHDITKIVADKLASS